MVIPVSEYNGVYLGHAWLGGTRAGFVSLTECKNKCLRSNPPCLSFDYNTQFLECFLHAEGIVDPCSNVRRTDCGECLHYRLPSLICRNVQTMFDTKVQYQSFNGQRRPGVLSLMQCLDFCQSISDCKIVDYNSNDRACWWHAQCATGTSCGTSCSVSQYVKKVGGCSVNPSIPTSAVVTSPVSTTQDPRAGEIYNDVRISVSYSGGRKVGNYDIVEECQNQCYNDLTCQGVDYNRNDKSCWLLTSSHVCGTERTSCSSCTHYKNKRASCYIPGSGTQPTTQAPSGTTDTRDILSYFKVPEYDRKLIPGGIYEFSQNEDECLRKCNGDPSCHAVAYTVVGQCYKYSVDQACGLRKIQTGWTLFGLIRQTCGQPIFNDFHAPVNTRKRQIATYKPTISTLQTCLIQCKADNNCKGVNYQSVSNRCEHVATQNQCSNVVTALNYVYYTLKTINCNPGVSTTQAPPTVISQCWMKMTQKNSNCAKPSLTTANLASKIQDMVNYCRSYNVYFECIVNRFRVTDCATVTRVSLEDYVSTLADLRTKNIRFCRIFSQGLQNCLASNIANVELLRCQNQVRPITAITSGFTPIPKCNKLRDYIECVRSVVQFRCRAYSTEYNEGSMQNILHPSFSDCAKSEPKISGMNTQFGPAIGLSLLEIRGRDIGPNDTPMLLFNETLNPCRGGIVSKNGTHFICKTNPNTKDIFFFVRLRYTSGSYNNIYFMTGNFTYKNNPLVTSLMPDKTVVGGGTLVTVLGTFLSYVVTPTFRVTREDNNMIFESICRDNEEDTAIRELVTLVCEVPAITLPASTSVRPGEQVNQQQVRFNTGLILDGVTIYQDLTAAGFRRGNTLQVYGPPDIDENPEKSFEFKRFWPVDQKKLEIPGKYLNIAATSRDYTVLIGPLSCEKLEISSTKITCEPPTDNPFTNDTQPPILVKAPGPDGFQTGIQVGTLDYQNSIFDNSAGKYGLIGAGVGAAVLLIILVVICCCCCDGCACNRGSKGYEESID